MTRLTSILGVVGALSATTLLGACSLMPTYERPATPIQEEWPALPKITYTGQIAEVDDNPAVSETSATSAGRTQRMASQSASMGQSASANQLVSMCQLASMRHPVLANQSASMGQPALSAQPTSMRPPTSVNQQKAAEIGWCDFFLDERLRILITLALENNRDLRIAVQRVQAARAQWQQQRGGLWPSIGVGVRGTQQRLPPSLRSDSPNTTAVTNQWQGGLGVTSFELDFFGRLRSLSEAAYQQFLATDQAYRNVQISLLGEVAQAYLTLRAAEAQLALTRQVLATRQISYKLVQRRFKGGIASDLDVEQAKFLLDSASGDLVQLARTRSQALNALALVVGRPLPNHLPAPAPFRMTQVLATVPAGLPSSLLTQRPDILSAEYNLKMANANIGAARAAFFPTISLTGTYGRASSALSGLWSGGDNLFWSFSPSITAPIFAGGSIQAGVDLARANKKIAIAQYEQSIQQAFREVADALAGEATYATQLQTLNALVVSSTRTLKLSDLRYTKGVDSYLQVQSSQIDALNAQLSRVQTTLAYLLNRVQLYKALGGGWQEKTVSSQQQATVSRQAAPL